MPNVELDRKDLLILFFLQQDSRISLSDLGKELDMTPAAISYRLNKLIDQNVIKKFSIEVNHEILTPNYQSFLIELSVHDRSNLQDIIPVLNQSTYFARIFEVASPNSVIGLTLPLSNSNLKELTGILNSLKIRNFSIIPVLEDYLPASSDIIGENISQIYCPLCQKSIKGEGIISEVDDNYLSFCCRECRDQFKEHYNNISES